ncbi:uncharacterized protein LOC116263047 [Nymphaea colorata]|nr:uncharacterized protein LOC116263047 [Nymphaea colorata]XP_049936255.1 uncharacterized protein LOC116263047 [Nymphaea colorata]
MASNADGKHLDVVQEESEFVIENKTQIPSHASTSNGEPFLSDQETLDVSNIRKKSHGFALKFPKAMEIVRLDSSRVLASPSAKFKRFAEQRDEFSRSVSFIGGDEDKDGRVLSVPFLGKISWDSVASASNKWIRDPMNMALFVWIIGVAVSGAILFMVMTGMLNHSLRKKSQRDAWFEVNNQILNALFTLMCLYQHPKRFYHLILLCRWNREDILKLRKIYCKNGTYKPHEWAHMMIVVLLLHLNCFAQYALCGLNWGYKRSQRPPIGVGLCVSVAIAAPAIAGIYCIVSPLGKEYLYEMDTEAQTVSQGSPPSVKSLEKKYSFASQGDQSIPVTNPEWTGGLFDLWDDISVAYLSLFCSFCVFGWNMERLGFGNMYVHIATFILLCLAPFWIFNLAAVNIDNEYVREGLGITGILLCVFGLLYGGFWRIQMRKRFNFPSNGFCCGKPAVTDCMQWLFCCVCSLAQEVRTGNFYEIEEDKCCRNHIEDGSQFNFSPVTPEDGLVPLFRSGPSSPLWGGIPLSEMRASSPNLVQKNSPSTAHSSTSDVLHSKFQNDTTMRAPVPNLIEKE